VIKIQPGELRFYESEGKRELFEKVNKITRHVFDLLLTMLSLRIAIQTKYYIQNYQALIHNQTTTYLN